MTVNTRRLVSIADARSELGGIGHTTIYDLINRGELIKVNIGRRSFITAESLDAYVSSLRCGCADPREPLTYDPTRTGEPRGEQPAGAVDRNRVLDRGSPAGQRERAAVGSQSRPESPG